MVTSYKFASYIWRDIIVLYVKKAEITLHLTKYIDLPAFRIRFPKGAPHDVDVPRMVET